MASFLRFGLVVCVLNLAWMAEVHAQNVLNDKPKIVDKPLPPRALDRREAMKLYGLGLMSQRSQRLLEAARHFEDATRLDPQAGLVFKALIPLYLALERVDDALSACRKTVDLQPRDHETWYLYGRLLKEQGKTADAIAALTKALACPRLKDQPEFFVQVATDLGQMREESKDIDGALAAYAQIAKTLDQPTALLESGLLTRKEIDAKAAELYEHIGTLALQARQFERAVDAFTRAQKKDPDLAGRVNYHLARVRLAQDRPEDALRNLDSYLKTQPQSTEPYELKITLLQKLGRGDEVLAALKDHAKGDAHYIDLQLLLARQYARERQWDEAEEQYKSIARELPRPDVYKGLFDLYKAQGPAKIGEAIDLLDKALKDVPGKNKPGSASAVLSARSMLVVLRDDPELIKAILKVAARELGGGDRSGRERDRKTWGYLAVLAERTKQLDAAALMYRECLNNVETANEVEIYVGYLNVLRQQRQYEEIVKVCRKGLKDAKNTNRLLFHQYLTEAFVALDLMDEAITQSQEAVKESNDEHRARFRLMYARTLGAAERYDRAIAECQAVLKEATTAKDIRDTRYALSGIYSSAKKHAQAEEQLRNILDVDANDASACNDLGYIMADQGKNLDEAEALIVKAIKLDREEKKKTKADKASEGAEEASEDRGPKVTADDDRDHAAYVDSLGWVLFRKGQFEAARKELEKATALPDGGDDPVIWDHLGDVYLRLNQPHKARAAWQQAEKLYEVDKRRKRDDQYKELKRKLKLLK